MGESAHEQAGEATMTMETMDGQREGSREARRARPDDHGDHPGESTARAFAALGSPLRLRILRVLVRAGRTGTSVGAVQDRVGLGASTLSHHLRALVQAGVIEQERDGRRLICRARPERLRALSAFLLDECCADEGGQPSDCDV